jgi:hypothetical protein
VQTSKTARETRALTRESTNDERGSERVLLHFAMVAPGRIRHPTRVPRSPPRLWCTRGSLPRHLFTCEGTALLRSSPTRDLHGYRPLDPAASPADGVSGELERWACAPTPSPPRVTPDANSRFRSGMREPTGVPATPPVSAPSKLLFMDAGGSSPACTPHARGPVQRHLRHQSAIVKPRGVKSPPPRHEPAQARPANRNIVPPPAFFNLLLKRSARRSRGFRNRAHSNAGHGGARWWCG